MCGCVRGTPCPSFRRSRCRRASGSHPVHCIMPPEMTCSSTGVMAQLNKVITLLSQVYHATSASGQGGGWVGWARARAHTQIQTYIQTCSTYTSAGEVAKWAACKQSRLRRICVAQDLGQYTRRARAHHRQRARARACEKDAPHIHTHKPSYGHKHAHTRTARRGRTS